MPQAPVVLMSSQSFSGASFFAGFLVLLLSMGSIAAPVTSAQTNASASAPASQTANATAPVNRAELNKLVQQQLQKNNARLAQLEQANQEALARNQELQLSNDNLTVQVQVLQSERSAQMFLYGAATLAVGGIIGFILANYILSKRRRW